LLTINLIILYEYHVFAIFVPGSSQTGGLDWRTGDSDGFVSGIGAPAYLSIPGYELCLESFTPAGASHSEICLPAKKPYYCSDPAWRELQDTFEGDCPNRNSNGQGKKTSELRKKHHKIFNTKIQKSWI